jgi:hypothetical protein
MSAPMVFQSSFGKALNQSRTGSLPVSVWKKTTRSGRSAFIGFQCIKNDTQVKSRRVRDGPQPRGESAREDGDGNLGKRKAHGISKNSSSFKLPDMAEQIAVHEPQ